MCLFFLTAASSLFYWTQVHLCNVSSMSTSCDILVVVIVLGTLIVLINSTVLYTCKVFDIYRMSEDATFTSNHLSVYQYAYALYLFFLLEIASNPRIPELLSMFS